MRDDFQSNEKNNNSTLSASADKDREYEVTIVQILFGVTLGICLLITLSACFVKNPSANSKQDALNDEPPSYDSIDFTKNEHELPTYDDIRNLQ